MTNQKLMNSGYPRLADDDYKTIDPRCVFGFLRNFKPTGFVIDPCAPSGSGIVDTLNECGVVAVGRADAFAGPYYAEWIVSNPPYKRGLVDEIIYRQIERLKAGEVQGVAMLMRWNFSYSSKRKAMFQDNPYYFGRIDLMFRPLWFEKQEGDNNPFHPYTWHIWKGRLVTCPAPRIMWGDGEKP
jgi:hypothetical protein